MARRLLVSDGTLAQEAQPLALKIAVGGVVKRIKKMACVENGIVRQFWPPAPGNEDSRITWNNTPLTVSESVEDPADSFASITFNRSLGTYSHKNYPLADAIGSYLSPALDGTAGDDGKYLIKIDQVSGSPITGIPVGYNPGQMTYDGSTGFYRIQNLTTSGNKVTAIVRFNRSSFTGASSEYFLRVNGGSNAYQRPSILIISSDHANAEIRNKILISVKNSAGTIICQLLSTNDMNDGVDHLVFFAFDGDAGTAIFRIDGVDEDDTGYSGRVAPTTGTLETSAVGDTSFGSAAYTSILNAYGGTMGYSGYREAYLTNYADFGTGAAPTELDESGWTEWGAQPNFWNEFGTMTLNQGSDGNMSVVGTITGPSSPPVVVWTDLNSAASFVYSLDETIVGALTALANISIATDDGGGLPVTVTIVTKAVTFNSEVRITGDIAWNTEQHDLVEIKESVDATCDLIFNPSGFAIGDADTSGSFNEAWHIESPNVLINAIIDRFANTIVDRFGNTIVSRSDEFTVKVVLVSGTAPTGSALGVELSLDEVRQWTLTAVSGENLTNALDVTVSDGVTPVTKRITMNSQRTAPTTFNEWTETPWFLADIDAFNGYEEITFFTNGIANAQRFTAGTVQEAEEWHSEYPTPSDNSNYEVRYDHISGEVDLITGSAVGVWLSLSFQRSWRMPTSGGQHREYVGDISVRRIGDIAVVKRVTSDVGVGAIL